jgi:hypothetical protein
MGAVQAALWPFGYSTATKRDVRRSISAMRALNSSTSVRVLYT